mmetsp:Transcript_3629/g.8263  ORF Transcript_3629/g.8263 Transcript_3629/m.8263 type:complete len:171 (+) Transcript_3629:1-513(+)
MKVIAACVLCAACLLTGVKGLLVSRSAGAQGRLASKFRTDPNSRHIPARRHTSPAAAEAGVCHSHSKVLYAGWGNYKSDGQAEAKVILGVVVALVLRGAFSPASTRNTYLCPSGYGKEAALASLQRIEPGYKCKDFAGLVADYFTAPIVLPGDAEFDPEFLKIRMVGMPK